ncbi:MAG: hypothetical protein Q9164_003287, partial [Protoblastenia rupestris]
MPPPKSKGEYIETDTGNKVARRAQLHGTQHIILGGRTVIQPDVCIRGDLVRPAAPSKDLKDPKSAPIAAHNTSITVGRYTFISSGSVLKPPYRLHKGQILYHPLKIGDHVFVGPGCVIEAASVGDHVHFGKDAVVGRLCVVKDRVK